MKLRKPKRKMPMVPVASMGDIAFLLIIFFVLVANFAKEKGIRYNPAKAPDIEKLDKSIRLSVVLDEEGNAWFQGEPIDIKALEGAVRAEAQDLPQERRVAMLKVDRDLPHETYSAVIMALSKAEVEIALVGDLKKGQ